MFGFLPRLFFDLLLPAETAMPDTRLSVDTASMILLPAETLGRKQSTPFLDLLDKSPEELMHYPRCQSRR